MTEEPDDGPQKSRANVSPSAAGPAHDETPEASAAGRALGERWLHTISGLADHQLRVAFARTELERLNAGLLASGLNHVCQLAEQSDETARQIVGAFVPTILDVDALDKIWSIRATAAAMALLSVGRLLRASTPEGHLLDQRADRSTQAAVMQNDAGKPLSLGERRALARRPSRATLDRLLRDPHPMVARIVLGNPRITEDDVVRMAAHRPALTGVAREVAMAWSRSARVRMAVILNPGVPPGIAVPLLPLLSRPDLSQVVRASDVPAVCRATAHEHYELRPPMPATDAPPHKH